MSATRLLLNIGIFIIVIIITNVSKSLDHDRFKIRFSGVCPNIKTSSSNVACNILFHVIALLSYLVIL